MCQCDNEGVRHIVFHPGVCEFKQQRTISDERAQTHSDEEYMKGCSGCMLNWPELYNHWIFVRTGRPHKGCSERGGGGSYWHISCGIFLKQ